MFDEYLTHWGLTPEGDPIVTRNSRLLPVLRKGVPAMLKVALEVEEKSGGLLMAWWDGQGAAKVFAQKGDAILLECAEGKGSLAELATTGRDDEATGIICAVVAKLQHVGRTVYLRARDGCNRRRECGYHQLIGLRRQRGSFNPACYATPPAATPPPTASFTTPAVAGKATPNTMIATHAKACRT
jgi:hypothetical protein